MVTALSLYKHSVSQLYVNKTVTWNDKVKLGLEIQLLSEIELQFYCKSPLLIQPWGFEGR